MGDLGNPHYNTAEEETEQRRADAAFLACPMCGGDDPNCELASRTPAETKSDPETGKLLAAALDAFWFRVTGTGGRLTASRDLQPDVAIRLECAAYDAIEAWRAENQERQRTPVEEMASLRRAVQRIL